LQFEKKVSRRVCREILQLQLVKDAIKKIILDIEETKKAQENKKYLLQCRRPDKVC